MKSWHFMTEEEVLSQLNADPSAGLSAQEAETRLKTYGRNELETPPPESLFKRFLAQMKDPMIIVLLVAESFLAKTRHKMVVKEATAEAAGAKEVA